MRYIVCPNCYAVVSSMTYRCPSCNTIRNATKVERVKLCQHDGTPIPVDRRFCSTCGAVVESRYISLGKWFWILVAASILITLLLTGLHHFIYTTYQQDSCKIENGWVSSWTDKSGTSYQPQFDYLIINNEQQIIAHGRGDLGLGNYYDQDETEQIIGQYPTGSTNACWYSPIALSGAVFTLPDEATGGYTYQIIWFLGSVVWLAFTVWCFVMLVLYPRHLRRRGVTTAGVVRDHAPQKDKNGHVYATFSVVEFQTITEPSLRCRTILRRKRAWANK